MVVLEIVALLVYKTLKRRQNALEEKNKVSYRSNPEAENGQTRGDHIDVIGDRNAPLIDLHSIEMGASHSKEISIKKNS